jgi:putative transposase
MPRPLRIEFENAQYHVINRGAGKKNIYKSKLHKIIFLELLEDAHKLFGIEIHAYCLMDNHYHLLLKTPHANLARAMRHINGIYTQRYNKLEKTDGALFRGRYKAIIVSYDEYFLNVSRYIHLNPVEANIVDNPQQYQWSSYQYYLDATRKPYWLNTADILSLIGIGNNVRVYKLFVKEGVDTDTGNFYEKTHTATIFGSKEFKDRLLEQINEAKRMASGADYNRTVTRPTIGEIMSACTRVLNVAPEDISQGKRGTKNIFRHIAIYACRKWSCMTLPFIANAFYSKSHSNISNLISNVDKQIKKDPDFKSLIDLIHQEIFNNRQMNT